LLIVDAVRCGGPPGTLVRLTPDQLPRRSGPTISPHEIGVTEILGMVALLGRLPPTLILGVQPAITDLPGLELTDSLQQALPRVCAAIVDELRALKLNVVARQSADPG
jgi:hydrogenase maturation protease